MLREIVKIVVTEEFKKETNLGIDEIHFDWKRYDISFKSEEEENEMVMVTDKEDGKPLLLLRTKDIKAMIRDFVLVEDKNET